MMDGQQVLINDSVHVLGVGDGVVNSVSADGSFSVRVGGGSTFRCRADGYVGNVRKVFWHNPMVIVPPKNLKLWLNFTRMATTNYQHLCDLFNEGIRGDISAED